MLLEPLKSKLTLSFFLCWVLQPVRSTEVSTGSTHGNRPMSQVSSVCQEGYLCLFHLGSYLVLCSKKVKKKNCMSKNCSQETAGALVSQICNGCFELLEVIYPGTPKWAFSSHSLLRPPSPPPVTWSHPSLARIPHHKPALRVICRQ